MNELELALSQSDAHLEAYMSSHTPAELRQAANDLLASKTGVSDSEKAKIISDTKDSVLFAVTTAIHNA
jgi:hypothetical protein